MPHNPASHPRPNRLRLAQWQATGTSEGLQRWLLVHAPHGEEWHVGYPHGTKKRPAGWFPSMTSSIPVLASFLSHYVYDYFLFFPSKNHTCCPEFSGIYFLDCCFGVFESCRKHFWNEDIKIIFLGQVCATFLSTWLLPTGVRNIHSHVCSAQPFRNAASGLFQSFPLWRLQAGGDVTTTSSLESVEWLPPPQARLGPCLFSPEDDLVGPTKSNKWHVAKLWSHSHTREEVLTQCVWLKPRR